MATQSTVSTVAQGLRRVKKLKGQLAELTARAAASVSYTQAKKPDFDFAETRKQASMVRFALVGLEAAIAKANATTTLDFEGRGVSVAEAIRLLQELKAEMAWLRGLRLHAGVEVSTDYFFDEQTGCNVPKKVETVYVSDLSEVQRVKELESLQDRFERLNDLVETSNHRTSVDWSDHER